MSYVFGTRLAAVQLVNTVLLKPEIIDIQIVLDLLEKACKDYKVVKVTFHGGEPTLAGIDFYNIFLISHKI